MSTYDDASLIYYPSGYKAGKAYSLKPTDGSGDLDFTRASTATRVNAEGLIEGVRTNLVLYSEDLTNAYWTKIFATISGNSIANPLNGAVTADTIIPTTDNNVHRARLSATGLSAGQTYTYSFYAKANGYNFIRVIENTTTGDVKQFNLSNGTIDLGTLNGQIVSLGNGWYRCNVQIPVLGTSQIIDVQVQESSGVQSYTGNGTSGIYIYGAQLEQSPLATEYIPTTTTAVSVGMLANVPRIDFTGGGCGKLLLEPQRANLLLQSNNFSTSWSIGANVALTANFATSPDGTTNASRLLTSGTAQNVFQTGVATVSGSVYTVSIYAKNTIAGTSQKLKFGSFINGYSQYTLTDDWVRYTHTFTSTATSQIIGITSPSPAENFDILTYQFQCELGSYPTSLINTTTTAVTRVADNASKSGISSLIGQTEGVLYANVEFNALGTNDCWLTISSGTNANWIFIGKASNKIRAYVKGNGVVAFDNQVTNITSGQLMKIAIAYKSGDIALYINGSLIATSSNSLTFSAALSLFASDSSSGSNENVSEITKCQEILIFPTRLSNAELAALTTI